MHKVARIFVMQWSALLQYRLDIFLWMMVEAMTPLVSLAVWYKVAQQSEGPLTATETLTYYLVVMFVFVITNSWSGFFFAREILNGELVRLLARPLPVFWRYISENVTEKTIKLFIPILLFALALVAFPHLFSSGIYHVRHWLFFTVSLGLATILSFVLDMCFGVIAFWIEDSDQLRHYKILFHEFTSGVIIPFALMPLLVQRIVGFLPFRYIISVPTEILLGRIAGAQLLWMMTLQALWAAAFVGLLAVLYRRGLKRYAVPGQ